MGAKAIVVGIGHYPKFGTDGVSSNDLPGAIKDAEAMADWLCKEAGADVKLITSNGGNGVTWDVTSLRPEVSDINKAFLPYVTSTKPKEADRLYVYVAGHGLAPAPRSRCLITADAVGTNWVQNLDVPYWIDWFATRTHFDELVLWMDCCGTQALDYPPGRPGGLPNVATRTPPPAKVFMAFGSGFGKSAYEGPIGPAGETRGFFTEKLLRGLKGGASDLKGEIRSGSLANYLRNGVAADGSSAKEGAMIPQEDDMLLARARAPLYRIRVQAVDGNALPDGTLITVTAPPSPLTEYATTQGGWISLCLGVGLYKLTGFNYSRLIEIGAETPIEIG